jgi:hypothetical protein
MLLLIALCCLVLGYLGNDAVRWLRTRLDERRRQSERWRR